MEKLKKVGRGAEFGIGVVVVYAFTALLVISMLAFVFDIGADFFGTGDDILNN